MKKSLSSLMTAAALLLAGCIQKPQGSISPDIVYSKPILTEVSTPVPTPTYVLEPTYAPLPQKIMTIVTQPTDTPTNTPTNTPMPTETPTHIPTPTAPTGIYTPTLTPIYVPSATPTSPINPIRVAQDVMVESPSYCINISIKNNASFPNHDLGMVAQLDFPYVKELFQWGLLESENGRYDWLLADNMVDVIQQYGLRLIARLDFAPEWALTGNEQTPFNIEEYAEFVHDFVSRYKGKVFAIEAWNEPNLAKSWAYYPPNPEAYVEMLKASYNAAKSADPNIIVISAALSATGVNNEEAMEDTIFLKRMYEAGAAPFFDALGAHGTGFKAPPEMDLEEIARNPYYGAHRSFGFRRIEDLREIMVENGDSEKQIWLTEFGWTSDPQNQGYSWYAVPEKLRAEYYVRAFYYAKENWKPWTGMMCVWTLGDREWRPNNEMYWWAILNEHGNPRPAYNALRDMQR